MDAGYHRIRPSLKMLGVHGQVVGTEEGMIPLEAENGIKVMSVNLLLDNEEDRLSGEDL